MFKFLVMCWRIWCGVSVCLWRLPDGLYRAAVTAYWAEMVRRAEKECDWLEITIECEHHCGKQVSVETTQAYDQAKIRLAWYEHQFQDAAESGLRVFDIWPA